MLLQIPDVLTAEQVRRRAPARPRRRRLDRRPRDRRPSVGARERQPATPRGLTGRATSWATLILAALQRNPLFIVGGAAAARVSAAVQPLRGRAVVRQSRRQRHPPGDRHAASHPHRSVGHAVLHAARTSTTAASCGRRHLRRAQRQAAGGPPGAVSVDQPAPRPPGDARRARRVVLLDSEHGARRRPAHAPVRSRHGDSAHQHEDCRTIPPPSSSTGVYHNLLRHWAEV